MSKLMIGYGLCDEEPRKEQEKNYNSGVLLEYNHFMNSIIIYKCTYNTNEDKN